MLATLAAQIDRHPALAPAALLATGAAVLAAAYGSQHLGGLQPCELCLYQRWPWWIATALAASALLVPTLLVPRQPQLRRLLLGAAGLAVLAGAAVAAYHVGVEQKWWQGPTACSGTVGATTLEALRAQIMAAPIVRCDEAPWSLFGVSMAGYNALLSLAVGTAGLWAAWRTGRVR